MAIEESSALSPYRILGAGSVAEDFRGGGFAEEEVHLRDYWRVVLKHRTLVLAVFLASVVTTALVVFTMDPLYTATATIQIERQAPKMAPVQEVQQIDAMAYDKYDYYQTQFEILTSRTIAARVIKALGLDSDTRFVGDKYAPNLMQALADWVRSFAAKKDSSANDAPAELGVDSRLITRYLKMLAIEPVRNSRLVRVAFTSKFEDLSAEVANKHVEEYTNTALEQRLGMTLKAKEFLENELAKAKDRVVAAEAALNSFRRDKGVVSLDGDKGDVVSARLEDLNKRFTAAQADRIKLEGQYQLIKKRDFESLPDVVSSPLIAQLKQEAAKVEAERAELERKFKPGYPKMKETIAREEQAKSRINAEVRKIVEGIESAYMAARSREDELGKQLEAQRQAALSQKDVGADYDTLKRDVDTARALYGNLLQRLKDVDVAEEIKVSNVSVVDQAAVPLFPSRPKKKLDLVLAAMMGVMMGVGLAFFLEYLDNTLKTPEDVERRLGLPTLGVIPSFDIPTLAYGAYGYARTRRARANGHASDGASGLPAAKNGKANELVVVSQPRSVVAESYRTVRTGILLSSADNPPQVILFTSGSAGEGKTVTAVNQAMTLAQSGGRILIIDADIRKPRLHRMFKLPNGNGLSTYLTGQSSIESVIHEVPGNGNGHAAPNGSATNGRLFILPSGPMPPNPAELLGSQRMREVIAAFRADFDYIVIDTPPVLPVTDAVLLATMADGVVLVVRGQQTPIDIGAKARDRLLYARAKILGVVLNDVDVTSGDYENYHRYYYSYYAESESSRREA